MSRIMYDPIILNKIWDKESVKNCTTNLSTTIFWFNWPEPESASHVLQPFVPVPSGCPSGSWVGLCTPPTVLFPLLTVSAVRPPGKQVCVLSARMSVIEKRSEYETFHSDRIGYDENYSEQFCVQKLVSELSNSVYYLPYLIDHSEGHFVHCYYWIRNERHEL